MVSSADFPDLKDEQNFYVTLHRIAENCTIIELWNALKSKIGVRSPEIALACADIAMCAGDRDEAFRLYEDWLNLDQGATAFLPLVRVRIAAGRVIEPALPDFALMVSNTGVIEKLIGMGALFCLGRWTDLEKLLDDRSQLDGVAWQISAAVAFAKAALFDYTNASAFFLPALLQGHGSARPHNGLHSSIAQAAEECSSFARQYTSAMRAAEYSLMSKGLMRKQTADPLDFTKIDLFIKTCAKDEEFLVYCLKSIDRFVSGFRRVVIVTDEGHDLKCLLSYDHTLHKVVVPSAPATFGMISGGYRMQMVVKLCWMDYSDADAVVITDSDTIFTRPFSPEQMFLDGKPIWYYGEWSYGLGWRAGSELAVGAPMPYCCMREHPFIFTRDATLGFHDYIRRRFGCSVYDLFFSDKIIGKMCEFEILGGYLAHISSHGYNVLEHQRRGIVRQYWSWGGLTDEVKANLDEHLQIDAHSAAASA